MNSSLSTNRLASQLLQLDEPLTDRQYKEYRMSLESALTLAQSRQKLTGRIAVTAFAVAMILMFVGGTKLVGDFDPWSDDSTLLSITLGGINVIANVTWPIALAIYFSRFRPKIADIKEQIRDTSLLLLQTEVAELRREVNARNRQAGSAEAT